MGARKEKRFVIGKKLCLLTAAFTMGMLLLWQNALTVHAQGTATVKAASGKIREAASTTSTVKASVVKDDKLDVIAQTTDADGYTWYKVYVNGTDTGYIRADLLSEVSGSVQTESSSSNTSSSNTEQTVQKTEFVQVTEADVSAGKVAGESVNVRENPSTNASIAGKATGGTEVAITGQATDGSGKLWYQVNYGDVTGFIRSDFLEIIEQAVTEPLTEPEEIPEEPAEEEAQPVNKDYELVYEENAEGIEEWFLYDYTRGTKQSLADLLSVVRQSQEEEQGAVAQLKTFKILTIVMAVVVLALIVVVTILIFKLRDSYEYEYEDEEDEEDEDEVEEIEEIEDEEEEIVRRPAYRKAESRKTETKKTEQKDTTWQSRNFLDIDDDMEFEFLDLK